MADSTLKLAHVLDDAALFRLPRIIAYNRLEARPRTTDFSRSLRAEVRDALWMLTRQWQFGEFLGEDAASPLTARIAFRHSRTRLLSLRGGDAARVDPAEMPLETRVEREPIPLTLRFKKTGEEYSDVLFAVRWGKRLLEMMQDAGIASQYALYVKTFPIRVWRSASASAGGSAAGAGQPDDADAEAVALSARRIADGVAIWRAVVTGKHDSWVDTQTVSSPGALKALAAAFAAECTKSLARVFTQPPAPDDSAWVPNRLEYQFAVAPQPANQEPVPVLRADQYSGGQLDWHSFDAFMDQPLAPPESPRGSAIDDVGAVTVESFLPGPVRFKGQPQPRFWEMEASETNFGKLDTSATGLLHLLLAEFGLVYSNDWFMLPHPMDINTVCEVGGILVDDTFGRHTFVRPTGRGPEALWQRFAMFHLTEHGARPNATGNLFYLPPVAGKVLESAPIERVNIVRDEMANMVWGIEAIVPSQTGQGMSGYEASRLAAGPPVREIEDEEVRIAYVAATPPPKNWTPFIPVHATGSVSEIRLQRARMVGGETPRGRLLREQKSPYFIEEEEIPRAGAYVERSWQRTRWLGGRTLLWVGRRKTAGRGEGLSNLAFDQIQDLRPKNP